MRTMVCSLCVVIILAPRRESKNIGSPGGSKDSGTQ